MSERVKLLLAIDNANTKLEYAVHNKNDRLIQHYGKQVIYYTKKLMTEVRK